MELNYPTSLHKNYIIDVTKVCNEFNLSLIIKGSLAEGKATSFSDIDLIVLGEVNKSISDKIISCYGIPIMTNFTEKPKGIVILLYEDGLSIDLEFRKTITTSELNKSIILVKNNEHTLSNSKKIEIITSKYLVEREKWYKDLRLAHRALIKFLANKEKVAFKLLEELKDLFSYLETETLKYNSIFTNDLEILLIEIFNKYNVDARYKNILNQLLTESKKRNNLVL